MVYFWATELPDPLILTLLLWTGLRIAYSLGLV